MNKEKKNPFMVSGGHGTQPETFKIWKPFWELTLQPRGWKQKNIHGNSLTGTLPDKCIYHPQFKTKMIELKVKKGETISLSDNQKKDWVLGGDIMNGLEFWVIAADDLRGEVNKGKRERMYNKLFEPANCEYLIHKSLYRFLW